MPQIFRTSALAMLAVLAVAAPSQAYTLNLGGTYVPPAGQYELVNYFFHQPFDRRLEGGRFSPLAAPYHVNELWSSLEIGLGDGFATSFVVPYDALSGTAPAHGLADATINLSRQLWKTSWTAGRLRLRADLPTGAPGIGSGVAGLGLLHSQAYKLTPQLTGVLNFNCLSAIPRGSLDALGQPQTSWNGPRVQVHSALDYRLSPQVSCALEEMWQWRGGATLDGRPVAGTDGTSLNLAPSVTYMFSDSFALQAGLNFPVHLTGNQDSGPWSAVVGSVIDF